MTDRDALLSAICEHPDEDTPRLMYADLLDEEGGDENTLYAKFIRLQIEAAKADTREKCIALRQSSDRLLEHLPPSTWKLPARDRDWSKKLRNGGMLWRGFLDEVKCSATQTLELAKDGTFSRQPIRKLRLLERSGRASQQLLQKIIRHPELQRVQILGLYSEYADTLARQEPLELPSGLREIEVASGNSHLVITLLRKTRNTLLQRVCLRINDQEDEERVIELAERENMDAEERARLFVLSLTRKVNETIDGIGFETIGEDRIEKISALPLHW
jgi:uncharacterized protein (TIGR02996 family)